MMTTGFCLAYKKESNMPRQTEFEKQMEIYESLMDEVVDAMDRADIAAGRARTAANVLCKSSSSDHLEKAAGLLAVANEAIARVESLQRKAQRALDRADAARADYQNAALLCQPMPVPRGFLASTSRDESEAQKTLSAGVIARRFTRGD
jgi:hypothetical protein